MKSTQLFVAAALLVVATMPAQAQKVLRISSWAPPTHMINGVLSGRPGGSGSKKPPRGG